MARQLQRTQILLESEQHRMLGEIARRRRRSLSDVVREITEGYLQEQVSKDEKREAREALQALAQLREEARRHYRVYTGDLIAKVRAEREAQLNRAQAGEE